jgi:release factor glutamine methyltransferase
MILKELITLTTQILNRYPDEETYLLLEFVLNKPKSWIIAHSDLLVNTKTVNKLLKLINRRITGEPTAYLIGKREFYTSTFLVNKSTLIPRPETEILVDLALKNIIKLGESDNPINILEIGTGTGCISISIIKALEKSNIRLNMIATDISKRALKVAEKNYELLIRDEYNSKHTIEFMSADIINTRKLNNDNKFDLIISNPPYIPTERINKLSEEVRMEPYKALNGGKDGMNLIRKLFNKTKQFNHANTKYLIEIDSEYIPQLTKWLSNNLIKSTIIKDQFGEDRFLEASFIC